MPDIRRTRLATLGGLLAAGLVLAACGGGSSHSAGASVAPTTTTTVAGGRGGAALAAFTSCMNSHGVTVPTRGRTGPSGSGGPPSTTPGGTRPPGSGFGGGNLADRFATPPAGVDPAKYATALAACKSTLPTVGPTGGNGQNNSAFQAYRSCLSDHGVTLPTSGGGTGGGLGSINRNDPTVKAALTACQALLPAGGSGGTTTTTAPPA
jgi:hypothetical protein